MKDILHRIEQLKRDYAGQPFFDFLRNDRMSAIDRLAFFPCMAPFILAFGDLNRHVLRVEPTRDPCQALINAHTYEDDHHWPLYLEDLGKLGHDRLSLPSDVMRDLWSTATVRSRLLSHHLAHLIWNAQPPVRLAIVEAIEATGNVLFALTSVLAGRIRSERGLELRYLGDFHFQLESGHAMNADHGELAAVELDPDLRSDALIRVQRVFDLFADWTEELRRYAENALSARDAHLATLLDGTLLDAGSPSHPVRDQRIRLVGSRLRQRA